MLGASAHAQQPTQPTPPPDYGVPITLDQAKEAAAAAQAEAKKNGWRLAIAVVDPGGHLVYFERTDGTQNASVHLAEAKARTALITYGSPLCRLYMRAFPNYFNEKVMRDIADAVAGPHGEERWINLWRRTDPIGGAIGIGDRRLADPSSFGPLPGDRLPPAVQAHSNYQLTPQFAQALDDLVPLVATP